DVAVGPGQVGRHRLDSQRPYGDLVGGQVAAQVVEERVDPGAVVDDGPEVVGGIEAQRLGHLGLEVADVDDPPPGGGQRLPDGRQPPPAALQEPARLLQRPAEVAQHLGETDDDQVAEGVAVEVAAPEAVLERLPPHRVGGGQRHQAAPQVAGGGDVVDLAQP